MAIVAALVHRTVAGQGQYINSAIHEACALTTEAAIANYVYRGEVVRRQTGRHLAAGPTPRTQFRAKDGTYVCALVAGRLTPKYIGELADLLDTNGQRGEPEPGHHPSRAAVPTLAMTNASGASCSARNCCAFAWVTVIGLARDGQWVTPSLEKWRR